MRDLGERDEIRAAHPADTGAAGHIERLMGERENAAAYGRDASVIAEIDEALAGFGYEPPQARAAKRKAAAEKRAAAAAEKQAADADKARRSAPEGRRPAGRQST